MVSFAKSVN